MGSGSCPWLTAYVADRFIRQDVGGEAEKREAHVLAELRTISDTQRTISDRLTSHAQQRDQSSRDGVGGCRTRFTIRFYQSPGSVPAT